MISIIKFFSSNVILFLAYFPCFFLRSHDNLFLTLSFDFPVFLIPSKESLLLASIHIISKAILWWLYLSLKTLLKLVTSQHSVVHLFQTTEPLLCLLNRVDIYGAEVLVLLYIATSHEASQFFHVF